MKVKTREDALLHCFDWWLWLACNPTRKKYEWPGLKSNGGYLEKCDHNCPCCEYASHITCTTCENCILKWSGENAGCIGTKINPGEFRIWKNAETPKEKTKWALKICELCIDAL